ncbi:MAG: aminopeptidase P N-terminal domain-containing protein [Leadbetterella sp.]|nr:aminopeptidase P N-terminal domain-containing protein [Leadbetterella sp.]
MSTRYEKISSETFALNRKKYLEQMPDGSVSVFAGNDLLPGNADGTFGFIQNSTFFYLTGIDQEDGYLILVKGEGEWLFIKETSELIKIWDGDRLSKEEAAAVSGIKNIHWLEDFREILDKQVAGKPEVWLHLDTTQAGKFRSFRSKEKWLSDTFRDKYPQAEVRNPEKYINGLRLFKSESELLPLRRAIEITRKGLLRAARFLAPGKYEFEVEAEITHEFMMNRSRFHAFQPIVASGANACVLHYIDNNRRCEDGELVLIDFGAEYGNYKADMTRTLPVNGKFSDRQAEVYSSVLQVMKTLKTLMVNGNTVVNLKQEALNLVGKEMVKLGLASAADVKSTPEMVQKYLPHGVSHSLGIDVHDVGDRNTPFAPGMVLTLEPGIYIREEGIGIRLENDILITESGNEDLMAHVPLEIEDIERAMKQ